MRQRNYVKSRCEAIIGLESRECANFGEPTVGALLKQACNFLQLHLLIQSRNSSPLHLFFVLSTAPPNILNCIKTLNPIHSSNSTYVGKWIH